MGSITRFFGKVFGSDAAIKATAVAVKDSLDMLVYTDEEKDIAAATSRTEARGMVIEWMKATQGQNLSRRFLAFMISCLWALSYVASWVLGAAAFWVSKSPVIVNDVVVDISTSEKLTMTAELISNSSVEINSAFMLVLGFYFALPHMGKITEAFINKNKVK